ncbi:MAG TPA: amidohydrolase family protein [Acidimicrobiales bacterium]|nr:amidohydrolase family protein [Acidimicrobiales bacterium]|tara:strand:- start:5799 stop:6626 length:828 start_codon:yes stop_codon:yes gene_type:complete
MLVDTHIHLIGSDRKKFPLNRFPHPGDEWIDSSPDVLEYLTMMEETGVSKALLIQPHAAYQTDNRYICSVSSKHSEVVSIAIVNPTDPDGQKSLRQLVKNNVRGLRLFSIPTPAESWIGSPETSWLWHEAQKQGLVISVCVLPSEIQEIGRCAEKYPDQMIVVDHCGFAPIHDVTNLATQHLLALSQFPNIILKVTTLVIDDWIKHTDSVSSLFPVLAGSFGSERLVWGSDFAQTKNRTYKSLVDLGLTAMESLGSSSEAPMASNAQRLWGLDRS